MNRGVGRRRGRVRAAVLLGLLAAGPARSGAADAMVPGAMQASMTVRILEYDRGLAGWAGSSISVGLVAKNAKGPGLAEFRQALAGREVQGIPVTVAEHTYRDPEALREWIERTGVRLVYVAADVGPAAVPASSGGRRVLSLVPTRDQFQGGATLGLVVRDGKPHILVNLPASRAAGMSLDPKLLQLSEVVR